MMYRTIFLVVAFVLADTVLIFIILWLFFRMMRRMVLSSRFPAIHELWPAETRPPGRSFYRQNIALHDIWYKNAANLVIADEGLYVSFGFPVSLSIPQAALIPWKYFRYQSKGRAFWTDVYKYQIMMEEPVICTVMRNVAGSFPEELKPEL